MLSVRRLLRQIILEPTIFQRKAGLPSQLLLEPARPVLNSITRAAEIKQSQALI